MTAHSYKKDVMIIDIVFYYTGSYRETQVKAIAILLNALFMSIAIIFKSNTYETNHKGEITEVIPPLLFQQLINLLFQFLILSLQKALLFQGFLFMLLRFLNLHTKRDQLMLQIIHLLILLL